MNNIGYGFVNGKNKINKKKILAWKHSSYITWRAYLWYIAEYIRIVDFDDDSFTILLESESEREFLYKWTRKYDEIIQAHNYEADINNSLWSDHKKTKTTVGVLNKIIT